MTPTAFMTTPFLRPNAQSSGTGDPFHSLPRGCVDHRHLIIFTYVGLRNRRAHLTPRATVNKRAARAASSDRAGPWKPPPGAGLPARPHPGWNPAGDAGVPEGKHGAKPLSPSGRDNARAGDGCANKQGFNLKGFWSDGHRCRVQLAPDASCHHAVLQRGLGDEQDASDRGMDLHWTGTFLWAAGKLLCPRAKLLLRAPEGRAPPPPRLRGSGHPSPCQLSLNISPQRE